MDSGRPGRQQGMALVMGLIILLVMTLVSISAMESTLMQERMAGAMQSHHLALQAAEAALRRGERHLRQSTHVSFRGGNPGLFHYDNKDRLPPAWSDPSASVNAGSVLEHDKDLAGLARNPLYFIEKVPMGCRAPSLEAGTPDKKESFRIMALGFGSNENTRVVLEGFYCR